MNRMERVYRIHRLVGSARRPVSMRKLQEETQSSRNTVTRDMAYMKDYLGAPLVYDAEQRGHRYDPAAPVFELPGLWMSSSELHARSEEYTSELQSRENLVCRLLLEKKKQKKVLGDGR